MTTVSPSAVPATGAYAPLGDKSLSHRALLFAALAEGESEVRNFPASGVTYAMLRCLKALGVACSLSAESHLLRVKGVGLRGFKAPEAPLDCGNSATTIRLLAGVLAGAGVPCTLTGTPGLRKRPMDRIVEPLRLMGAAIEAQDGRAPLTLAPAKLGGIAYTLPVASAQVKSCLLLAGLYANAPTALIEPGPSRDHTERMLAAMGAQVRNTEPPVYGAVILPQDTPLSPLRLHLPGDVSSAAFLILRAYLQPGSDLTLQRVCVNPTRTGFIEAMQRLGADIAYENAGTLAGEPVADLRVRYRTPPAATEPICFSGELIVRMIDELPALMVAAAYTPATVIVRDAAELRAKESDRIAIMAEGLRRLGATIEEYAAGLQIVGAPGPLPGGATVETHGDHRVAMSLALATQRAQAPVIFDDFACVRESFPDFYALCHLPEPPPAA